MRCVVFSLAVLLMSGAGLALMVGWRSGAAQLARIAIALVIGSALVARFVEVLHAFFAQAGAATLAVGFIVLLFLAVAGFAIGWLLKKRSEPEPAARPTIRRRVQLVGLSDDSPPALPAEPPSTSTDDLHLFGGGQ